eukprot:4260583-Amphidinium_carterae.1
MTNEGKLEVSDSGKIKWSTLFLNRSFHFSVVISHPSGIVFEAKVKGRNNPLAHHRHLFFTDFQDMPPIAERFKHTWHTGIRIYICGTYHRTPRNVTVTQYSFTGLIVVALRCDFITASR